MKHIKIIIILFAISFFIIFDDIQAATCQYNVGGIACCKRLGEVKLVEGTTHEKVCPGGIVANSDCGEKWSECKQVGVELGRDETGRPTEANCKALNGIHNNGTIKYANCKLDGGLLSRKCVCDIYQKKVKECCKGGYKCPEGTEEKDGVCVAKKTTTTTGCVEYEVKEDERVCPAFITWESKVDTNCYSELSSYSDAYDWESCVYTDNTMKEDNYGDSTYCPVYCIENFSAYVTNNTPSVKAGTNFVFPNSNNSLSGQRWCKTKEIDYEQFLIDLEYANSQVVEYYRLWKMEEDRDNAVKQFVASEEANCATFCDENEGGIECCTGGHEAPQQCDGMPEGVMCDVFTCDTYTTEYPHGHTHYFPATGRAYRGGVTIDGVGHPVTVDTWCDYDESAPVYNPDYYKGEYEKWVRTVKAIYQRMKNCYEWGDFSDESVKKEFYNVDPDVSLTYQGANGNKYNYNGNLNVDTEVNIIKDEEECIETEVKVITGYDSDNNRIVEKWPIKKCERREVQADSYSALSLKDDVYKYVNKISGLSFHAGELGLYINNKYFNYIDIGYGNLPVGFATKPGLYGWSTSSGELSIFYTNIGHLDENGESRIEKVIKVEAAKQNKSEYNKIYCDYEVTNGIVPDEIDPNDPNVPDGVRLIYRPIDLHNPFPSIDGSGRDTGANWCDSKSCINTNYIVDKYILHNRDVEGNDVYNLEPMYSFTLTPKIINQIREYNKNNNYDYDNEGIKTGMICDKGTGEHCISEYLTELISMTDAKGTCTLNRKSSFDTCRYTN